MNLLFKSIDLDTIIPYLTLWQRTEQKSSDYSSGVLLCWEKAMGYQIAFEEENELAWIRGEAPDEHCLAPVGKWEDREWGKILRGHFQGAAQFRLVPEKLVDIWKAQLGDSVEAISNRASWEYLHNVSDLAELSGNKYMRKRNRINQFTKQNPYRYIPIATEELPRIVEFQKTWCEPYKVFDETGSIENESEGIVRNILGNWDKLPQLMGGAIEVLGKIVAYTVAEKADDETLMIHFEKASLEYNAVYQVINRDFLSHEGGGYAIVNREEDMDDPGLREAKMSYHPIDFVKKYTVNIQL